MVGICLVPLLLLPVVDSLATHNFMHMQRLRVPPQVSPKLDPVENKRYLKDYPVDKQPGVNEHYAFKYPYPAVQDTTEFDSDYVKDQNEDGGKFLAQMTYDEQRNLVRVQEKKLDELKGDAAKKLEDLNAAKEREGKAEDARKKAEAGVAKAKAIVDDATKTVEELEAGGTGAKGEAMDLEECKKQLAAAQAELKKKLEEKKAADEKSAESDGTATKTREEILEELEARAKETKAKYDKAHEVYKEKKQKVETIEADMKKVEERLRTLRHKNVDKNGGIYYKEREVQKSGASSVAAPGVLLLSAFVTLLSYLA